MPDNSSQESAKDVTIPLRLLEALRPQIEEMGETVPALGRIVPKINLDLPIREVGQHLGALLKNCHLYRKGPARTIVAQLGNEGWKVMSPHRFCGWVEKHVTCFKNYRGQGGAFYEGETSMGKDL